MARILPLPNAPHTPPSPQTAANKPKRLDRVRQAIRLRHYSRRTEAAYIGWIRRYILFHKKRHPLDMGAGEIAAFLSYLALRHVSASTQNQALGALLFLYQHVLGVELAPLGYAGGCYRAANWIEVGETAGRGRDDRQHHRHGARPKRVFVYPLTRDAVVRLRSRG